MLPGLGVHFGHRTDSHTTINSCSEQTLSLPMYTRTISVLFVVFNLLV